MGILLPHLKRRYRNRVIIGHLFQSVSAWLPTFIADPLSSFGSRLASSPKDQPSADARAARRLSNSMQC